MKFDDITSAELTINIHHVGGIGGYGPAEILNRYKNTIWVVYDADKKSLGKSDKANKKNYILVNKCIGKKNSTTKFNIMNATSASSTLKSDPKAAKYTVLNSDGTAQIWGVHTKTVKTIKLKTYTLNSLVNSEQVPPIDFLSMDTQGSELDIIEGANEQLKSRVIGVATETDFSSLYNKQPLFADIQNRLKRDNFRFCQIYNFQFFNSATYSKELLGVGFLTVGESIFLKEESSLKNSRQDVVMMLKLAAICILFDQLELALEIIKRLENSKLVYLETLYKKTEVSYISLLNDLNKASKQLNNKTLPQYKSTNKSDQKAQNFIKKPVITKYPRKLFFFTKYNFINFLRLIEKSIFNKSSIYLSPVSRIYSKYNLEDLALKHDKRIIEHMLFSEPSKLDWFISFLLYKKGPASNIKTERNHFKGRFL